MFVDFLLQVKVCHRHVIGFFVSYQFGEPAKGGSGFAGFISGEEGDYSVLEVGEMLRHFLRRKPSNSHMSLLRESRMLTPDEEIVHCLGEVRVPIDVLFRPYLCFCFE